MREIDVKKVTDAVAKCCIDSCYYLPASVLSKLEQAETKEESPLGRQVLDTIIENARLATKKAVPMCQDTGLTVVYIDIGQDVHFTGGDLWDAINRGVAQGYTDGYLRKSSVDDPVFERKNTKDNTPAIIHCRIVPGDKVRLVPDMTGWQDGRKEIMVMNCRSGVNTKLFFQKRGAVITPHDAMMTDEQAKQVMWDIPFSCLEWAVNRAR